MNVEEQDRLAVAAIQSGVPGVVAIYRFGSSVGGGRGPGSDVDLAVLATAPLDPLLRFDLQERLASTLRQGVDLVDLRAASPVMAIQVIGRGQLLFDSDPWTLLTNQTRQDAIILNLQRACESSIDAAMHLVRVHRLGIPQETREAFD